MLLERNVLRLATDDPPGGPGDVSDSKGEASPIHLATRILIIEDEVMIAWMVESLLLDMGFSDILIASDADQAASVAASSPPGLIVSDINLGRGPDGIEAAISINRAGQAPVIFVTAYADAAARQRITAAFPQAQLLRKPVERQALVASVQRALRPRGN